MNRLCLVSTKRQKVFGFLWRTHSFLLSLRRYYDSMGLVKMLIWFIKGELLIWNWRVLRKLFVANTESRDLIAQILSTLYTRAITSQREFYSLMAFNVAVLYQTDFVLWFFGNLWPKSVVIQLVHFGHFKYLDLKPT